MRQIEVSRTLVFDAPAAPAASSKPWSQITSDRPEEAAIVFARQVRKTTREPFGTRLFSTGTEVRIDFR
jgi:hypothetical protein